MTAVRLSKRNFCSKFKRQSKNLKMKLTRGKGLSRERIWDGRVCLEYETVSILMPGVLALS